MVAGKVRQTAKGLFFIKVKYVCGWGTKFAPRGTKTAEEAEAYFQRWQTETLLADEIVSSVAGNIKKLIETTKRNEMETIATLLPKWELYRKNNPNAKNWFGNIKNWMLSHPISKKPIGKLLPPDVRTWIRTIDRAPYTVRNIISSARTLIDDARKEGWIEYQTINIFADQTIISDVVNNGKGYEKSYGEENTIRLSLEQRKALVSVSDKKRRAEYIVALTSGLRESELAGLQWKDIDFEKQTLSVERQLKRNGCYEPPKKDSYRTLPLHPLAMQALDRSEMQNLQCDVVFGRFQRASVMIRRDLVAMNVPEHFIGHNSVQIPIDFHSTRRTFASTLDSLGTDRAIIGACMGHRSGTTLAKHYLAKNLEIVRESINKITF